ncbi:hypothetical protein BIFANG_02514 [Bifidobacterium angulatum DSM 20098 = JCM 7096]|uniref:Uncharacterized protein n=1 Tax=Bifidobacterium angulatum DSM 20098 = JCM 7096 TaxID=518635 RepID=C4FDX6_9BIFI|nr:hypothetical protein BIFANG_02514 [Bifidobacterium angulatum DSM 20098 = JCM 7096]
MFSFAVFSYSIFGFLGLWGLPYADGSRLPAIPCLGLAPRRRPGAIFRQTKGLAPA